MGLFRKKAAESVEPDEALPFLTVPQADRLRVLVRTAFAERGLEADVFADHLRDNQGRTFGLWNVAANCHGAEGGEREWPAIVDDHLTRLLVAMDAPDLVSQMGRLEEVARSVHVRLYESAGIPDGGSYTYGVELVPGVVELLAVDFPESVAMMTDGDVERLGGRVPLRRAGLANLARVEDLEHEVLRRPDGTRFDVVMSDSVYTSSLVVLLPELLERVLGSSEAPYGVFVCMPFRHQVAVHVLRDASAVPTLQSMTGFAVDGFDEGAGALTPFVYWWHQGSWTQVSRLVDGELRIEVGPELAEVLERVAGG